MLFASFFAALGVGLFVPSAHALTKLDHLWKADGNVTAFAVAGDTAYIGGEFTYIGPASGPLVVVDAGTANRVDSGLTADGSISAAAPDGEGGWYLAGGFTFLNGAPRIGLAHLRSDLTLAPWAPAVTGVQSMTLDGNTLYIGGAFTVVDGQPRGGLAAFDVTTGDLLDWNPTVLSGGSTSGEVMTLAVSGSVVYVGGWFDFCGGMARANIAAVDRATGLATDWNPGTPGAPVKVIVPFGTSVFAGGWFSEIGGQPRTGLAELDAVTGSASPWAPVTSGAVTALVLDGATLYVGGGFSEMNGVVRNNAAALDVNTLQLTSWDPNVDGGVEVIAVRDQQVWLAGGFHHAGGAARRYLAGLDGDLGQATGWEPVTDYPPAILSHGGSGILLAGAFTSFGGVAREHLAALDLRTGRPTDWNPGTNNRPYAMTISGSNVYLSGYFTEVGGLPRNRMAAVGMASGQVTPWNPSPDNGPWQMVADGASIYVGGGFTTIGGQTRMALAALDTLSGAALPWAPAPNLNGWVHALAKQGSTIYVGGQFTSMNGEPREHIAALDISSGALTSWNPGASGNVYALAAANSVVYAGGAFTTIGGQARSNIAALDPASGLATAWDPSSNDLVRFIAPGNSYVFVSGEYGRIGGNGNNSLAALDPVTGRAENWHPASYYMGPFPLVADGGRLFVGAGGRWPSRAPFGVFSESADVTPPVVRVEAPNGGEHLVIGQLFPLSYLATDDGQIAHRQVFVSRNGATGPWENIDNYISGIGWDVRGPVCDNNAYIKVIVTDVGGNVSDDISDGPFSISSASADTIAPVVHVQSPNGLEEFSIGQMADSYWSASDNVAITRLTLYLSRVGPAGPWELIGDYLQHNGHYAWPVTGPTCLLTAYFRVDASDAGGNLGTDISDQPFTITDGPVPTLTELFRASPTPQGVRIEWRFSDPAAVRDVQLQRAPEVAGEWVRVAQAPLESGTAFTVLDGEAPAGETSWYRLSGTQRNGGAFTTAPVSVLAGERITAFALATPAPNPSSGRSLVTYALPRAADVRVTLVDVQGREVSLLAEGPREAGRYTSALDASDLKAGLYFVRLQAGGVVITRRMILVR